MSKLNIKPHFIENQFVLATEAELYIRKGRHPHCQLCNIPVPTVKVERRGYSPDGIPQIDYDFECHRKVLRFVTFVGEIARVQEIT